MLCIVLAVYLLSFLQFLGTCCIAGVSPASCLLQSLFTCCIAGVSPASRRACVPASSSFERWLHFLLALERWLQTLAAGLGQEKFLLPAASPFHYWRRQCDLSNIGKVAISTHNRLAFCPPEQFRIDTSTCRFLGWDHEAVRSPAQKPSATELFCGPFGGASGAVNHASRVRHLDPRVARILGIVYPCHGVWYR